MRLLTEEQWGVLHERRRMLINSENRPEWYMKAHNITVRCKCGNEAVFHCPEWDDICPGLREHEGLDHDVVAPVTCDVCGAEQNPNGDDVLLPDKFDHHVPKRGTGRYAERLAAKCYCHAHCPKHQWTWDVEVDPYCEVCHLSYIAYLYGLLDKHEIAFERIDGR